MSIRTRIPPVLLALLLCPLLWLPAPAAAQDTFRWQRDTLFEGLEAAFHAARAQPSAQVAAHLAALTGQMDHLLEAIARAGADVPFDALARLEPLLFQAAAQAAAHPDLLPDLQSTVNRVRGTVSDASRLWPVKNPQVHEAIYRVLYGGRAALEEALIQNGTASLPSLVVHPEVPSVTPSIQVEGVTIHSGDILLSRGGAPTSALIARGSPFPGNFSHVALAHVDIQTGVGTVIESLIETGTKTTTVADYLKDKKLRVLVLRVRPDHPQIAANPMYPHQVAETMLRRVRAHNIPYDFAHWWQDETEMFCAEVVYHAYRGVGIGLWRWRPTLTAPGLRRWLGDMGVENFEMLVPSDLEYDPQLTPVAEWRSPQGLWQDRLDNVVLDVLLEQADAGKRLEYALWKVPLGWATKLIAPFMRTPIIPPGMGVTAALRAQTLVEELHPARYKRLEDFAVEFYKENGYQAPVWELIRVARGE
ncbi:MAG: YiiX/YebB-like N1pC/P60 family cysteine hydrolase [Nitrospirota bacterium]|nr:YiiX/YebB-like N1pC/P60 family cysteine hydrolase [Nitrospirota bacterium]